MFTGIIQNTAAVKHCTRFDGSMFLTIQKPAGWKLKLGDSVAINGVCLTVRALKDNNFEAELMPETLALTSFKQTVPKMVNLERPLTLVSPLDGHLVLGHVDAVGKIVARETKGRMTIFTISYPAQYKKLIVSKGSVAVDGVSLTVAKTIANKFSVALVDYTLEHTVFGNKKVGDTVNIEFDIVGKYIVNFKK